MKKIKGLFYGTWGVGKSVFALGFPKPFFITTDGNYDWLEDFGAKKEDHKQVYSYLEATKFLQEFDFKNYDTIVVDLLEDLFKWCEQEYVTRNKFEYLGDAGHGKGYDITRNDFFIELTKLLGKDKHIILLMHEEVITVKDRRGIEKHMYKPSSRIPDKLLTQIAGRMRILARAYFEDVEEEGRLKQTRMLSLVPKTNEYGVIRGVNVDTIPEDIPLNAKELFNILETHKVNAETFVAQATNEIKKKPSEVKVKVKKEEDKSEPVEDKSEPEVIDKKELLKRKLKEKKELSKSSEEKVINEVEEEKTVNKVEKVTKEEVNVEKEDVKVEKEVSSNITDKTAAIKAKLAAMKATKEKK